MTQNQTMLTDVFNDFIANDLMDDRREYSVEDFKTAYHLTQDEADRLYAAVQAYIAL